MQQASSYTQQASEDLSEDRRNRFLSSSDAEQPSAAVRERAASQPPRSSPDQIYASSPSNPYFVPSSLGGSGTHSWSSQRTNHHALNPTIRQGLPQSVPTRSASIVTPQASFSTAMRESRAFGSTYEDDESEAFSDSYDELFVPPSVSSRGRTYAIDPSRSRSQSLATTRPGAIGGHFHPPSLSPSAWPDASHPLSIPGAGSSIGTASRFGEIKPPATSSRYGLLRPSGRSPSSHIDVLASSSSPPGVSVAGNGFSSHRHPAPDVSNMSPFVRDVSTILHDDSAAFREVWTGSGMNPQRNENGGGSGTTSRRHSVSIVQPRRGGSNIVGFSAPDTDGPDEPTTSRTTFQQPSMFGRGGLLLTDDELASDLNLLSINTRDRSPSSTRQHHPHHQQNHPPSQPASLPIYAPPMSHSPPSTGTDRVSPYQSINLHIPSGSFASRQKLGSPTDTGFSPGGAGSSPTRYDHLPDTPYFPGKSAVQNQSSSSAAAQGQGQDTLPARFIPGQGIQYLPSQTTSSSVFGQTSGNNHGHIGGSAGIGSNGLTYGRTRAPSYTNTNPSSQPLSPITTRVINPQQPPYYPQPVQRRPSDAAGPGPSPVTELGKGVPLHAVPASWPLFIVEFKAGRTDLFYLTDLSLDIRVGDLVIVEADRGKDLGKVVNDSITLAEVEAFQKQQMARVGYGGDGQPTSPGGSSSAGSKKEISPKMIYCKAQPHDTQLLVSKMQDEMKALQLCQSKVRAKKLPMEVIDAEYQWDRRKLTFYFVAEKRIDFRELVRELFRLYKTRIWMASLQGSTTYEQ